MSTIVAIVIATAVPLIFLYVLSTFDLYESGNVRNIALSFIWGGLSVLPAFVVNTFLVREQNVDYNNLVRYAAPIVEEILKALILVYLVRRTDFTYFVDGAIYGFAAGIGFAVFENYFYIYQNTGDTFGTAIGRVISTNLIHASATAWVGIALGMAKFPRFRGGFLLAPAGLLLAMGIHIAFNNLVSRVSSGALLLYAGIAGLVGASVIGYMMKRGLAEEKVWIEQNLGAADRVTAGEAALVQRLGDADALLAPLAEVFGTAKADKIYKFLVLQAQLGIKRKTLQLYTDEKMKKAVEKEMEEIRRQMDEARVAVGAYTMVYLRSIFPEGNSPVYSRLESVIEERVAARIAGGSSSSPSTLWGNLSKKTTQPTTPQNE